MYGGLRTIQVSCPKCGDWQFRSKRCDCGHLLDEKLDKAERTEIRIDEPKWRNTITQKTKHEVYERDDYVCQYCGIWCYESWSVDPSALTIDHMLPHTVGGQDNIENLITCCRRCNGIKSSLIFKDFDEARKYIKEQRGDY